MAGSEFQTGGSMKLEETFSERCQRGYKSPTLKQQLNGENEIEDTYLLWLAVLFFCCLGIQCPEESIIVSAPVPIML